MKLKSGMRKNAKAVGMMRSSATIENVGQGKQMTLVRRSLAELDNWITDVYEIFPERKIG